MEQTNQHKAPEAARQQRRSVQGDKPAARQRKGSQKCHKHSGHIRNHEGKKTAIFIAVSILLDIIISSTACTAFKVE